MASPSANPGRQIPVQQEQEKHFGPPVLGKKLFKAKAKGLNSDRFMTLPKGVTYFTDNKEKEKVDTFVSTALNEEYTYGYYADASKIWVLYDVLDDYHKEDFDDDIHSERDDWKIEITTIGGPEGHKVYFIDYQNNGSDIKEVYVNDIQYQALLRKYEQLVSIPKLYYTFASNSQVMW